MRAVEAITLEVEDPGAASRLYREALGLDRVRLRGSQAASDGFRGFTLSLVAAQPSAVDGLLAAAIGAGAAVLQEAKPSLWGYGGAVRASDGTVITVASQSKKDTGSVDPPFDQVVLQLGVEDVRASKAFYVGRGFAVGRSFGGRYVELDTAGITVSLNKRKALAKAAGVGPEGSGSHRLAIHSDAGAFTDPDGFAWEA